MEKKLIKIDETEFISNSKNGITKLIRYYELNGKKFRIQYENSNGSPLGFNSKKCLDQYSENDARWNHLEDISVLKMFNACPSYFDMGGSKQHCMEFFRKMEAHLVKIYS